MTIFQSRTANHTLTPTSLDSAPLAKKLADIGAKISAISAKVKTAGEVLMQQTGGQVIPNLQPNTDNLLHVLMDLKDKGLPALETFGQVHAEYTQSKNGQQKLRITLSPALQMKGKPVVYEVNSKRNSEGLVIKKLFSPSLKNILRGNFSSKTFHGPSAVYPARAGDQQRVVFGERSVRLNDNTLISGHFSFNENSDSIEVHNGTIKQAGKIFCRGSFVVNPSGDFDLIDVTIRHNDGTVEKGKFATSTESQNYYLVEGTRTSFQGETEQGQFCFSGQSGKSVLFSGTFTDRAGRTTRVLPMTAEVSPVHQETITSSKSTQDIAHQPPAPLQRPALASRSSVQTQTDLQFDSDYYRGLKIVTIDQGFEVLSKLNSEVVELLLGRANPVGVQRAIDHFQQLSDRHKGLSNAHTESGFSITKKKLNREIAAWCHFATMAISQTGTTGAKTRQLSNLLEAVHLASEKSRLLISNTSHAAYKRSLAPAE